MVIVGEDGSKVEMPFRSLFAAVYVPILVETTTYPARQVMLMDERQLEEPAAQNEAEM